MSSHMNLIPFPQARRRVGVLLQWLRAVSHNADIALRLQMMVLKNSDQRQACMQNTAHGENVAQTNAYARTPS